MDQRRFDDLTRKLGRSTSRRSILKALGAAALGGVFTRLDTNSAGAFRSRRACSRAGQECGDDIACCSGLSCDAGTQTCCAPTNETCIGDADCCGGNVCRPSGSGFFATSTCQPPGETGALCVDNDDCVGSRECVAGVCGQPPAGTCDVASTCPDKHYCSPDFSCLCIESAEGDIRCGQIPSCGVQKCVTSADCANLGLGYFCDTPNSGCCDDAELQRCIAPCEPAVETCETDADCDDGSPCTIDTCNTETGICEHTGAPTGTEGCPTGCPDCGTCETCNLAYDSTCGGACDDLCATATLCGQANQNDDFVTLAAYLTASGYAPDGEPRSIVLDTDDVFTRSVFAKRYVNSATGDVIELFFGVEADGLTWSYALFEVSGVPQYALVVDENGAIEQVQPSAEANAQAMRWLMATNIDTPDAGGTKLCKQCSLFCNFASTIECGLLGVLVCGGAAACGAVASPFCSAPAGTYCPDYCNAVNDPILQVDPKNCGACGHACAPGEDCCHGVCVDTLNDHDNCGGCGNVCAAEEVCCTGRCAKQSECCPFPQTPCDDECCDNVPCAPEGGCCPETRLCNNGFECCAEGQSCWHRSDGSSFCCSAVQACRDGGYGEVTICCPEGQFCQGGIGGLKCVSSR